MNDLLHKRYAYCVHLKFNINKSPCNLVNVSNEYKSTVPKYFFNRMLRMFSTILQTFLEKKGDKLQPSALNIKEARRSANSPSDLLLRCVLFNFKLLFSKEKIKISGYLYYK